jgi:hypothetical protein
MRILTPYTLAQTSTLPPSGVWIVEQLLRTNRQRISLLCGSPHAGKSTIARQLAISVAQGKPFLGRSTMQCKVAYWQSEETEEDTKQDFEKSGMQLTDSIVILHPAPGENNLKELDKVLSDDAEIRLVIIETLDDFLQMDDLSDNPSARRAFERFDTDVVSKHRERVCFLVLHHFKKSDEQRGSNLTKILGATVIAGKTDAKIFMRSMEGDGRRIVSAQIRKGMPIEATYLTFDEATQSSTLGQTLADERADSKRMSLSLTTAELRRRCIDTVAQNTGLTKQEARDKIGGKTATATAMLHTLIEEGVIISQLGGKTGTAHLLYIKGKEPMLAPTIPWSELPVCKGCGINKVAGAGFNAEWGAEFCASQCQPSRGISCVN